MEYVIWFITGFLLVYIIYYIFSIRSSVRKNKPPVEAQYLIVQYKLDIKKFSYRKFLKIVGLVTSFDIALVATVVCNVGGVVWQILFGFVAVVPVIIISFLLLGKYYQQKQLKDNSKELAKEKKYLDKINKRKSKNKKVVKKGK